MNVASLARAWATALACRLRNSTQELEKKKLKSEWKDKIIEPNSHVSFLVDRKASDVSLESVSKSTPSNCISLSHCKAECRPEASPTSTEIIQGYVTVLAITKVPSESRIQIPIPVWLNWEEKDASMLRLNLPGIGCCNEVATCCAVLEGPIFYDDEGSWCAYDARVAGAFANCQSTTIFRARSTIVAQVYVALSQTLRLRCFQLLEKRENNICCIWNALRLCVGLMSLFLCFDETITQYVATWNLCFGDVSWFMWHGDLESFIYLLMRCMILFRYNILKN